MWFRETQIGGHCNIFIVDLIQNHIGKNGDKIGNKCFIKIGCSV